MGTRKKLTTKERKFAELLAHGLSAVQAARKAFGWRCDTHTREAQKAKDLARSARVKKEVERLKDIAENQAAAEHAVLTTSSFDWDNLHQYAYDRLIELRDDDSLPAKLRFQAINNLEKLNDPAKDINLIWNWVDMLWRHYTAHCPCCHETFPLWRIYNPKLADWRQVNSVSTDEPLVSPLERKLAVINEAEKRKHPHAGQVKALEAPERHIAGMGAARAGKSFLLGMFGFMALLQPGVEIWLLARVYEDARSEFEYICQFLKTAFYPVGEHMFSIHEDKKTKERFILTKWDSELRVRSGKATGSITGRELEVILVAEPAWVDADLFNHVRARMSSRLGRIIALGTPQGYGGFLSRMVKMTGRNVRTGKKLRRGERLISNGCPWGQSIYEYNLSPSDNPEYVKSELEAARGELSEAEFASEFEGLMVAGMGAKFPFIKPDNLIHIPEQKIENLRLILGIDQGERNFGACLLGWDGKKLHVLWEYFDNTETTIRGNMVRLQKQVPAIISLLGGKMENWVLTICDADPPIFGTLAEMEDEGRPWPTDITLRPKNVKESLHWREETCMWVNQLGYNNAIAFHNDCDLLHDQLMEAMIKPAPEGKESPGLNDKGWVVNDPWRGDHVMDAFLMGCYTIFSEQVMMPSKIVEPGEVWEEAEAAFNYSRLRDEANELRGFGVNKTNDEIWEEQFGRPRGNPFGRLLAGNPGYYSDES